MQVSTLFMHTRFAVLCVLLGTLLPWLQIRIFRSCSLTGQCTVHPYAPYVHITLDVKHREMPYHSAGMCGWSANKWYALAFLLPGVLRHMPSHLPGSTKFLNTFWALVQLFANMLLHMTLQRRGISEGPWTIFTPERPLICVLTYVALQLCTAGEHLVAVEAFVWFFFHMRPPVTFQSWRRSECRTTEFTCVRRIPRVCFHVTLQFSNVQKSPLALFTFVPPLCSMCRQVTFQLWRLDKSHVTVSTFEWFLSSMYSQVTLEVCSRRECCTTVFTYEWPLHQMEPLPPLRTSKVVRDT